MRTCDYFSELSEILGDRPDLEPVRVACSYNYTLDDVDDDYASSHVSVNQSTGTSFVFEEDLVQEPAGKKRKTNKGKKTTSRSASSSTKRDTNQLVNDSSVLSEDEDEDEDEMKNQQHMYRIRN